MKWIGQHIWDFISRFRNDTIIDGTNKLYFNDQGGEYISGDGTDLTITSGNSVKIATATGNAAGSGLGNADTATEIYVANINGFIETNIFVDLDGLKSGGTQYDVIGDNGETGCYLTKIETAINGLIIRAKFYGIETLAHSSSNANELDLVWNTSATIQQDTTYKVGSLLTNYGTLIDSGCANIGFAYKGSSGCSGAFPNGLNNAYLYLANGHSSPGTAGDYTAGKLLIQLTGVKAF